MEDVSRLRIGSDVMEEPSSDNGSGGGGGAGHLEDVYRLPPTDIISIEEWKLNTAQTTARDSNSQDEPIPDYDDSNEDADEEVENEPLEEEEEKEEEDYVESRISVKSVKSRLSNMLSYDDWNRILANAERNGSEVNIPDPDYDENPDQQSRRALVRSKSSPIKGAAPQGQQLVGPKKLPNPVLESKERQELHRELLMNKKMGVDVLHKKSELKKEMDRRKDLQKKKEEEEYYRAKRSGLEQKLEEQANKLKQLDKEKATAIKEEAAQLEFLRVHSKISRTQPH